MKDMEKKQKAALFAYTDAGCLLAKKIMGLLTTFDCEIHTTEKFAKEYQLTAHKSVCSEIELIFRECSVLIFVCSCGIAVRAIAPYIRSKTTDPAVLVMDDCGKFVIPILSGHIGGANALAEEIANQTGALLVATTATDIHGRFSVDTWAARNNCYISSLVDAKSFSAAILKRDLRVISDFPIMGILPNGLSREEQPEQEIGLYIGIYKKQFFDTTLRLVPKKVILGIGCRKGVEAEKIERAVSEALKENHIDSHAVCSIVSIDVKKEETGLLEYAEKIGVPCCFFTAEELIAAEGEFEDSEFVRETVGVGNVCERAAALCGDVIIRKTRFEGVTVAAAVGNWEVHF